MSLIVTKLTAGLQRFLVRRWARTRLRRNDAVIIDTETTDLRGQVVQLSVIDLRGSVLVSTLVNPAIPISAAAATVHGISTAELATAPTMGVVAPSLLSATEDKMLLAYNAPFDREALARSFAAAGLPSRWLGIPANWRCLMRLRAQVEGGRWAKLGGPHSALGDCFAALEVLHGLAGRLPAAGSVRDPAPKSETAAAAR